MIDVRLDLSLQIKKLTKINCEANYCNWLFSYLQIHVAVY